MAIEVSGVSVYHLFARSKTVSIRRVRQLRNQICNEAVQQAQQQAATKKQKRKKNPKRRKRLKKTHATF